VVARRASDYRTPLSCGLQRQPREEVLTEPQEREKLLRHG
jgi:hypothetical protein